MEAKKINTNFEIDLENLQSYLSNVCSVVRDKEVKSNARLWERLLKESYGDKPSSVFSFIPCVINEIDALNTGQRFGYVCDDRYYTNARELLNWGYSVKEMMNYIDFSGYEAYKCVAPYFVYQQIRTHSQMNFLSHSARYTASTHGYWMPKEVEIYYCRILGYKLEDAQNKWNEVVETYSPRALEVFMRDCGVIRREVYARGKDMLQNRAFSLGGTYLIPNSFEHFINERSKSKHTQFETREFVSLLC